MSNIYSSAAKRVNNGKKTLYRILQGDQVMGDRTTARVYTVAIIGKHSRAYGIECAKGDLAYYQREQRNFGSAWQPEQLKERIAACEARLAALLEGKPDKFYDTLFVVSWHGSRATAKAPKHIESVTYVDLVQPA